MNDEQQPTRRFRAMGCTVLLTAVPGTERQLDEVERYLIELDQRWSRFLDTSELTRLNQRAGGGPVAVSEETYALVERMVYGWRHCGGAFDPTVTDALIAAGYDRSFELLEPPHRVGASPVRAPAAVQRAAVPAPGCGRVVLDRAARLVSLPTGVRLDPGGIGKGLAADLAVAALLRAGAEGAMASVGGDVRVCGRPPQGEHWRVEIARADGERAAYRLLRDGAVCTSSTALRRWSRPAGPELPPEQAHHVIDPATGRPADTDLVQVSVGAERGWWSEVLATAALTLGSHRGRRLLESFGADAVLIDGDHNVLIVGTAFLPLDEVSAVTS